MKKLAFGLAMVALAACGKDLPQDAAPTVIVARFDPAANPPVVPAPNDLATNPATGLLAVPLTGSPANQELAAYLDTLNGFPADTNAQATFTGTLRSGSVNATSIRVLDITTPSAPEPVTAAKIRYADVKVKQADGSSALSSSAPGAVTVIPPGGAWKPGHTYAIAVIGGDSGVRGSKNEPVVGSLAWTLIRSAKSIATCPPTTASPDGDLTSPDCRSNTDLVPSNKTDPGERVADQGKTAAQLEGLRRKYAPTIQTLIDSGVSRQDVALLFTFRIADGAVTPAFQLDADPCRVAIPLPNDLAIDPTTKLVNAPSTCAGQTPTESEFISDYLDHLDGFPTAAEGSARIVGGDLDASTVKLDPNEVVFVDLTAAADVDGGTPAGMPGAVKYDATNHLVTIDPPAGGWPKGHEFAVALLDGIKGTMGERLIASDVFALVRAANPLVTCDLTDPAVDLKTCHTTISLAPVSDAQAIQLEQVRLGLAPAFAALGVDRKRVGVLWTFRIFDNAELNFALSTDPAKVVIPFPFNGRDLGTPLKDALQFYYPAQPDGGGDHINGAKFGPLGPGLNTLDGFSTTAPIVTAFNSGAPRDLIDATANVDPASLTPGSPDAGTLAAAGLINLGGGEAPQFQACVNCGKASNFIIDGGAPAEPEQLAIVPTIPLLEKSDYGAYVSIAVKDLSGHGVAPSAAFALMRLKNPILDSSGTIQVPALAQAVAAGQLDRTSLAVLERLREKYAALFDTLDAAGLPRGQLALAWDFHTQSTWSQLAGLHTVPAQLQQSPAAPLFSLDVPYAYDVSAQYLAALPNPALKTNIGKVFASRFTTPFLLVQTDGSYGAFNLSRPTPQVVPLVIYEPTGTAPAGGWPVAFFGHGITRFRNDSVLLANSFNKAGFALVAFDEDFHGDRSFCVGAGQVVGQAGNDAAVCKAPTGKTAMCSADTTQQETYGRCLSTVTGSGCTAATATGTIASLLSLGVPGDLACQQGGEGRCLSTGFCEGATFVSDSSGRPVISGWNFIDLPSLPTQFFFPTRDHFRQDVVDLAQLELVLGQTSNSSLSANLVGAGGAKLDGTKINYIGQSLGGILGTLYTASSPTVQKSVLNVPGGNPSELLLTSPGLAALREPLLAALTASGRAPGTPAFDQFINLATWVMDPADPRNAANHLNAPPLAPANRGVLVQWIDQDMVVPNPTTVELIASANRDPAAPQVTDHKYTPTETEYPVADGRHGFLLTGFTSTKASEQQITAAAQTEAASFIHGP
jgi:hypothetical protein